MNDYKNPLQRVLLTTGGTGGHVFPALAVAEELQKRNPQVAIMFVGSQYGPEVRMVTNAGLEFRGLPVRGFLGRGVKAITAGLLMTQAVFKSLWIVCGFKPQVTVGFGGYAAFAPMVASCLRGFPTALHEQNAIAGVSNKVLARISRRVFLSMAGTEGFAVHKCVLTGNPVRASVAQVGIQRLEHMAQQEAGPTVCVSDSTAASSTKNARPCEVLSAPRRVLIMGGSLGARALNDCVIGALPLFKAAGVELLHQTGPQDFEKVQAAYVAAGYAPHCVQPFIDDMGYAYSWADLALCRAGATTVAELAAAALPAVLVPFPYAIHDHQTFNARTLARAGAAVLVQEGDMQHVDVPALVVRMLEDTAGLYNMSKAAHAQARIDAAVRVVDELERLAISKT